MRRFVTFKGAAKHAARMLAMDVDVQIVEDGGFANIEAFQSSSLSIRGDYTHTQRETLYILYKGIVGDAGH